MPQRAKYSNVWDILCLSNAELNDLDLVAANLAVAREIPSLSGLDISHYTRTVNDWTKRFEGQLPHSERAFRSSPERWKKDVRFFRVGQLAGFLGHVLGISYIESQRNLKSVSYTDPSDLFLNGVIDTFRGSCASLAAIHVAIARRLGWPVSLACVGGHFISRYDDGDVVHNIEMSSVAAGVYASDPDAVYLERFSLPCKAVECGSDLRCLTMREMIASFVFLRGRHLADVGLRKEADADYWLSRALFPNYRRGYIAAVESALNRGFSLFETGEVGHPDSLFNEKAALPHCPALS